MHETRAARGDDGAARGLAGGQRRLTLNDRGTESGDCIALDGWGIARHDDVRRNAAQSGRPGKCRAVVAGGMRCDATRGKCRLEGEDRVAGAARLESPGVLLLLAFEFDRATELAREFG